MPTSDFARQKIRTRRENSNSSKPSWKAINEPPKGLTKNRPFVFCTIPKYRIFHILSSRVQSSEQVGFDSYGSIVIVNNSESAQIFSEVDMFTDKIEYLIPKGIGTAR